MQKSRTLRRTKPAPDADLLALGRHLQQLPRRCLRLEREKEDRWAEWSAAVEETTTVATRISRLEPSGLEGLLVRYEAVAWMMLEADEVIVDGGARRAFVAFGKVLRQLAAEP
jgi:hypothetical protein